MATLFYNDRKYELESGETVLDCLLRHGESAPHSCRTGVCQTCRMQAKSGEVPHESQPGIKDTLKAQGYFLACVCRPSGDMTLVTDAAQRHAARVIELNLLSHNVMRVRIRIEGDFQYHAGQFITLFRQDGLARSFSIASLRREGHVELHVRKIPDGRMSSWIHERMREGDSVEVQGPHGSCFYLPGNNEQPLLLAGTGTGLAPLYGIARDALEQDHQGSIDLFHGAVDHGGLYLVDALRQLAERFSNFYYHPCVLRDVPQEVQADMGAIDDVVLAKRRNMKGYRGFLCGDPAIVERMKKRFFLAGMSVRDIHSDPFVTAPG